MSSICAGAQDQSHPGVKDEAVSEGNLQLNPDRSLQDHLQQLRVELQHQHELPTTEGYEEHCLEEPLKLRSQFWELEVDPATGTTPVLQCDAP